MSVKKEIEGIYSVGSLVSVLDTESEYYTQEGIIVRLGAAGDVVYYICKLSSVQTPITFIEKQLKKGTYG